MNGGLGPLDGSRVNASAWEPRLFLVVLGGRVQGCLIEQHDVRLVVGTSLEATIPELRRQWRGLRRGLHIDSWVRVERLEGYRVRLCPAPAPQPTPTPAPTEAPTQAPSVGGERLWFVNIGGYDPDQLLEQHAFGLFVARSAQAARAKARRTLLTAAAQQHKDDLRAVDDCLALAELQGWRVHLERDASGAPPPQPLRPDWFGYRRIDGPARSDPPAAAAGPPA